MVKQKDETTIQLEKQCERIAKEIQTGTYDFDIESSEYDKPCAGDYLYNILNYRFTKDPAKQYLGSRILVVFGSPTIWINTLDKCVEGYWGWGRDIVKRNYYEDNLGICDYMEELYESL